MTGHLDLYLFTPEPPATVTLVHDSGASYTAQSVDGHAVLGPMDVPDGNGATLSIGEKVFRGVLWMSVLNPVNGSASFAVDTFANPLESRRPASKRQAPLPPFDHNDPGGDVHTVLPPEQVISSGPDRDWWRGDAWSVTLDADPPHITGEYGRRRMIMSYLASRYPWPWLDTILTAHAERGYTHFHSDRYSWEWNGDGTGLSPAQAVDYFAYIQSYGFFASYWGIGTLDGHFTSWAQAQPKYQPTLDALKAAGSSVCAKTILIVAEEANSCTSPDGLLDIVTHLSPICGDLDIPMWLHFTSNYGAWPATGDLAAKIQFWRDMHALGVKGLCWQSNAFEPTGTMGARMYDSRTYLGQASTELKLVPFETRGSALLQGHFDEGTSCLTGYELLCCTRVPGTNYPAVAGFGSGARYPNGGPI